MSLEFWSVAEPKAKKEHECLLCGCKIKVGEKYHRFSGKNDDGMFDDKFHLECARIIKAFMLDCREDEWTADWVFDWLHGQVCVDCERYEDNVEEGEPDCNVYIYPHEGYCDKVTAMVKRILGEKEKR